MATNSDDLRIEFAPVSGDPMVAAYQSVLTPQDPTLARSPGKGVALYDEIRRDPHAHAVLQKRAMEVTAREWAVTAASDKRADKKAADLVERGLKNFDFDRLTRGLLGAVLYGFAVAEVIWDVVDGEWLPASVKVRRQRRFRFTQNGDLRLLTREAMFEGVSVPDRKFIVHRYSLDHTDDDPYGLGLGSVLFWPAWFKRQVLGHWLGATERYAEPDLSLTYDGNYDAALEQQLLAAAARRAGNKVMALPSTVKAELLEAANSGGSDALGGLSHYLDEMMSEAVLGETLSTNAGDAGSRALGEVHNDVRLAIAKADADLSSATINETLVRWIVDVNAVGGAYPTVWRNFEAEEDLTARADRDTKIVAMGYRPASVDYINETYGGDWVEAAPSASASAPPAAPTDRTAAQVALATAFAEAVGGTVADPLVPLVDRLAKTADAPIGAMIERIRREAETATTLEDFATRLLVLSGDLSIDDLAADFEQALTVAALGGAASVEGASDGG